MAILLSGSGDTARPQLTEQSDVLGRRGGALLCKHVPLWAVLALHPRPQGERLCGAAGAPGCGKEEGAGDMRGLPVVLQTESLHQENRWPGQACAGAGLETGRGTAASCYFPVVTAALGG